MASSNPENKYKSGRMGAEASSCDILSVHIPIDETPKLCLRPSGSCADCPVKLWWEKGQKESGLNLDQAIKMAKERAS